MIQLRPAAPADLPGLRELIPASVRAHSRGFYSEAQIESAIRFVFGPDTQLIEDGTYLVAESGGTLVGCGGWSRRRTLYGGDQMKGETDPLLDPASEPARIRAFFVHAEWGRQGIGTRIFEACADAARRAAFQSLQLMATLPGVPLYERLGFQAEEHVESRLPDGVVVPFVRMSRDLASLSAPSQPADQ